MEQFAKTADFCPNEACPDYGKLQDDQQQNIIKFGTNRQGLQRYRCKTCKKTFATGMERFGKREMAQDLSSHNSMDQMLMSGHEPVQAIPTTGLRPVEKGGFGGLTGAAYRFIFVVHRAPPA